jgi:hypothetical protein
MIGDDEIGWLAALVTGAPERFLGSRPAAKPVR